jgi:hypothetical protein
MCYSVESSLKTTAISLAAIIYLLASTNRYYQWIAVTLVGWCFMQFSEFLLWLTDPRKCTEINTLITYTLIPLTLMMQALGVLLGSFLVFPWSSSSEFRKVFTVVYSIGVVLGVLFVHFYNRVETCTIVTKDGHLYWTNWIYPKEELYIHTYMYFLWVFIVALPFILFWNKKPDLILALFLIPLIALWYAHYTDAKGSIWCYYTSYSSIIASAFLLLDQLGIYKIVK